MSKIGRKPIDIGSVDVQINGQEINYKGKKDAGTFSVPHGLKPELDGKLLSLTLNKQALSRAASRDINRVWGLNRALLSNTIKGANADFERVLQINGLGFKATQASGKLVFSLGYTHKIDFALPQGVTVEIDKTGQRLAVKCPDKELLGLVVSKIRAMRPPEPYKGTGIKYDEEVIARKAGKAKAAA